MGPSHRGIEGVGGRRTEGQDIICIYEEYVLYNIFITHSVVCNVLCHTASCTVGLDSKVSRPQSKIQRHLHNMFYIIHIYIDIYLFCTRIV